jgi:hypothetical protein
MVLYNFSYAWLRYGLHVREVTTSYMRENHGVALALAREGGE